MSAPPLPPSRGAEPTGSYWRSIYEAAAWNGLAPAGADYEAVVAIEQAVRMRLLDFV